MFSDLGRVRHLKEARRPDRRRRLRREPGRRGDRRARAVRRPRLRPADAAPPAGDAGAAARARPAAGRHRLPGDREVRPPAAGPRDRADRVRLDHGGLLEVLLLLRRPVHPGRGSVASARRRAGRDRRARRPGVREVTLLGQNVNAYRGAHRRRGRRSPTSRRCSTTSPRSPASSGSAIRPAIRRSSAQRLVDAHGRIAKLAGHVHLPVQHGSDRILAAMKRGYTALEFKSTREEAARGPARHLRSRATSSSAFRARPAADFERTMALVDEIGFDHSFSFVFSPRPGTPAAALADDTPGREAGAPAAPAGRNRGARQRDQGRAASARSAPRRRRAGAQGRRRARRAHRMQPRRQLRRPGDRIGSPADVRITEVRGHSLRGELVA